MRLLSSALFLMTLSGPCAAFAAQMASDPPSATAQVSTIPSATVQPALGMLQQALDAVQLDKWKISGAVREETAANISSLRRDLETMLPPLLAAADGAPDSIPSVLPVFRNIEALYDVLLRIAEVSKLSAPSQQSAALEHAMESLGDARRSLGDRLQSAALAQDQQLRDLQAALRATPAAPLPVVPAPCPPPAKKHKSHPTPARQPAPAATNSQGGVPPSP